MSDYEMGDCRYLSEANITLFDETDDIPVVLGSEAAQLTEGSLLTITLDPALTDFHCHTLTLASAIKDFEGLSLMGDTVFELMAFPADANGDAVVDPLDNGYVLARFGPLTTANARADVNTDGIIDPLDAGYVLPAYTALWLVLEGVMSRKTIYICKQSVMVGAVPWAFAVVNVAQADLLATYDSFLAGGTVHVFESVTARTYLSDEFNATDGKGTLFEDIVVYDGETRIDVVTDSLDADFADYQAALTDGDDWWLYDGFFYTGGSRVAFQLESVRLDFSDPAHDGVDLEGYLIDNVTRTISVELETPGSDPNGDGQWTDFEVTTLFEIYGQPIPEPTTTALVVGGLLILHRRRRLMG